MFAVTQRGVCLVNLDLASDIFICQETWPGAGKFGVFAAIPCSNTTTQMPAPTFLAHVPAPAPSSAKLLLGEYSDAEEAKSALKELTQAIEKGERIHRMREAKNEEERME